MKSRLVLFSLIAMCSCKSLYVNAWKNANKCCEVYGRMAIDLGTDSIYPGISSDSISMMYVNVAQIQKSAKIDGPDYCMMYVIDEKNDTIARSAINGLPVPGKSRTYPLFGNKVWRIKPNLLELRFSLEPYCNNLPFVIIE
jgi:hypothetical protein